MMIDMAPERVIYDDDGISFDDSKRDLLERSYDDGDEDWVPNDEDVWTNLYNMRNDWWENDVEGMLKPYIDAHGPYVLTGYCGLWDGKQRGGAIINDWHTLSRIFGNGDRNIKIYDVGGRLCFEISHHDGTNYWELYKLSNSGVKLVNGVRAKNWDREKLVSHILADKVNYKDICFCRDVWGVPRYAKTKQEKQNDDR